LGSASGSWVEAVADSEEDCAAAAGGLVCPGSLVWLGLFLRWPSTSIDVINMTTMSRLEKDEMANIY